MSFKEINRVCVCGHKRERHVGWIEDGCTHLCNGCYAIAMIHNFKVDNLVYLQEKYEAKNII